MEWLSRYKSDREVEVKVVEKIDEEILQGGLTAEEMSARLDMKRKIKFRGVDTGDVAKIVANVAIVVVLVGFEMSNIMNQKGSRFIKVL